jgi:hypothetical protein
MLIRAVLFSLSLACAVPVFAATPAADASHDGRHDFDFEAGAWTTKVHVLRNPMSGAALDWADYLGSSIIHPLMDGRTNLVELSVAGTRGKIEGVALRLYNPQARQWSLNYAGMGNGLLTAPVFGSFDDKGRGAFYGHDMLDGRAILVRFIITQVSPAEAHFEQAFSADGGATWEVNWIAVDTRRPAAA